MSDQIDPDTSVVCQDCGRALRDPVSRARRRGRVCQARAEPPHTGAARAVPAVRHGHHGGQVTGQATLLDELPVDQVNPGAPPPCAAGRDAGGR